MKKIILFVLMSFCIPKISAQEYFPNNESITNKNKNFTAFTNAKIFVTPTQILEKATLLVQDGKVIAVGTSVSIPKNCIKINLEGKSIYPSFIDIYTNFGVDKPKAISSSDSSPLYDTKRKGYYWNEHIRPETNAYESFKYDEKKAEEYLKLGFGVVGTNNQDGIARGTGALIALNNSPESSKIISNSITNNFGFTRSGASQQSYPNSLMGMIALLRQMYYDLDWYKKGNSETTDLSLEALARNEKLIQIFATEDKLNSLRAAKIGKEFGINYILKGSGNEFERIDEIKNTNAKFIIPLNFPEAYDVSNSYQASQMELSDLRFWNQAPTNPKILSENGIVFALTTDKLKKLDNFKTNLLKAIKLGFDKTKALESLTTIPASILGKSNEIGSLKVGSFANFVITSGEIFDEETTLFENWVQGTKYVVNDITVKDIRGDYDLTIDSDSYKMKIDGKIASPKVEIKSASDKKVNSKLTISNNWITLMIRSKDTINPTISRLSGYIENTDNLYGKAIQNNGDEVKWSAKKTTAFEIKKDSAEVEKPNKIFLVTFPNLPFGNAKKLVQQTLLFKTLQFGQMKKKAF